MNDAATTCEHVRPELSAYIDGELPATEAARVEQHLHECRECRTEEAALRSLAAELAALPRRRVPRDLAASVRDNGGPVRSEPGERLAVRDLNRRARRYLVFAQVMASAALIVLCVTVAWRLMDSWGQTAVGTLATRSDFESPVERRVKPETATPAPIGGVSRETPRRSTDTRDDAAGRGFVAAPPPATKEPQDRLAGVAGQPIESADEEGITLGATMALSNESPEPTVNVVVAAQTMEQFNNAILIVQNAAPGGVRQYDELSAGRPLADDGNMSASPMNALQGRIRMAFLPQPPRTQELELRVEPEEVWSLINSLELNAPRQLAVEMNFRGDDALRLQNAPTLGLPAEAGEAIREDLKSALSEDQAVEAARRIARVPEAEPVDRAMARDKEKDEASGDDAYKPAQNRTGQTAAGTPARPDEVDSRERTNAGETRKRAGAEAESEGRRGGIGGGRRHAAPGAAPADEPAAAGANAPAETAAAGKSPAGQSAGYKFTAPPTTMPYDAERKQVTFRVRVLPPPTPTSRPQTTQPSQ